MKLAPNLLTNKYCLCKSARRRRGAAYFDLATELRVRISRRFGSITIPQMMVQKMPLLSPCDSLLRFPPPLPRNAISLKGCQERNLEAEHGFCVVKEQRKAGSIV
jgi:hypothetical protein